ncbi:MAG: hypothetical protein ACJ8M1_13820 [Chthoniobacterales bacterium]
MARQNESGGNSLHLLIAWLLVGIPLMWGVWTTILKLPALFK